MEIPVHIVAAAFTASLLLQGWQVRMLYSLRARICAIEATLEFNGMKLPALRDV